MADLSDRGPHGGGGKRICRVQLLGVRFLSSCPLPLNDHFIQRHPKTFLFFLLHSFGV